MALIVLYPSYALGDFFSLGFNKTPFTYQYICIHTHTQLIMFLYDFLHFRFSLLIEIVLIFLYALPTRNISCNYTSSSYAFILAQCKSH